MAADPERVDVETLLTELQGRVRERLRTQLSVEDPGALVDPEIFAEVEALLSAAAARPETSPLLLPRLLGEPSHWRLTTVMRYQSHRPHAAAAGLIFVKRRILMPMLRWLFEYSRDNFERQRRTNHVLFACIQELAVQNATLQRELRRLGALRHSDQTPATTEPRSDSSTEQ